MFPLAKFVRQKYHRQKHATVTTVLALASLGEVTFLYSCYL
jgi:hypothetical protein